ncbi:hypothetical protein Kpol_1037p53 [Vanderwaltozyma polyspora DSM 70294]|uniref:Phosphatidate cytidylyltransferase n=1 Tax=Vanderwaltozyma polyspora (strain ATCC 22028 / DSM 70294 / BCRC 21397 / CBS 2163 / NBRC 10782 / NRRL Y-8283 / UCD 57-17) TaxID=436907 RepID=A7TJZ4_VANPO|nr:uncharacterized protein Kpol_1037p53 [Vanderwaltozyma polyspora DSM 70294]EDO17456.1 hypothetical protein Kpol_1037p53 [Vanderwaltozyma polyspora DSM 70294]
MAKKKSASKKMSSGGDGQDKRHKKGVNGDSNVVEKASSASSSNDSISSASATSVNANASPNANKRYNFIIRTSWTFVMLAGFFAILASGHFYCVLLIIACQVATFKECIAVTGASGSAKNLPLTKTLNWYLLFTTIYYLDGKTFFRFFQNFLFEHPFLTLIVSHHKFVCYFLYLFGFIFFVCTLRKGFLKFQFASLCITHMALALVVFQAHLIIKNVINGLFWFLVPCGLVIVNDIFAYLCGITFGRTKLIEISPKKTLEGFIGAWFFTALASVILTRIFEPFSYMTCPVKDINTNFFSSLTCELNPVFIPQRYPLPPMVFEKFGISSVTIKPIYFHALNLATFASLFAPFGGFFASGLKRTFKVKDFGDSIPGHGGITDRIDCQFLMGSFTNLYYETFISENRLTVEAVLSSILLSFNDQQILEVLTSLTTILTKKGIFKEKGYNKLIEVFKTASKELTQ